MPIDNLVVYIRYVKISVLGSIHLEFLKSNANLRYCIDMAFDSFSLVLYSAPSLTK